MTLVSLLYPFYPKLLLEYENSIQCKYYLWQCTVLALCSSKATGLGLYWVFSALALTSGYQLKNSFQEYHVAHLLQSLFVVIYNLSQETICQTNKKQVQISEH